MLGADLEQKINNTDSIVDKSKYTFDDIEPLVLEMIRIKGRKKSSTKVRAMVSMITPDNQSGNSGNNEAYYNREGYYRNAEYQNWNNNFYKQPYGRWNRGSNYYQQPYYQRWNGYRGYYRKNLYGKWNRGLNYYQKSKPRRKFVKYVRKITKYGNVVLIIMDKK